METTRVLYIATVKYLHHRVDHGILSIQSDKNVKSKKKKKNLVLLQNLKLLRVKSLLPGYYPKYIIHKMGKKYSTHLVCHISAISFKDILPDVFYIKTLCLFFNFFVLLKHCLVSMVTNL